MIYRIQGEYEKEKGIFYEFDPQSKPLGEGGMGKVFLGQKVVMSTGTKTPAAIKIIHDNLPEHVIERARREASIQIHSDNLVEMFGFIDMVGNNQYGDVIHKYFVISEYLNGVMLDDFLNKKLTNQYGEINPFAQKLYAEYQNDRLKASVHIIKCVLSAIMLLHDKGFIHRDIDPTNIMITMDGNIKLIDFGIAKKINSLNTQDKALTSTGAFIGKPQYAAPELVTGDVQHQDVTTDIYAIGILFYQLLTGELPFSGASHIVMDAQLHKKMPLNNISNRDCSQIIGVATSKNQKDRYSSSAAFRVAVESIDPNKEKTLPNKKLLYGAVAAIILLIIGIGCFILFRNKEDVPITPQENIIVGNTNSNTSDSRDLSQNNKLNASPEVVVTDDIDMLIANLDSDDPDIVKQSWKKIKDIDDNSKALYETGLTYCTSVNSGKMNDIPKKRQRILGINDMKVEVKKKISHEKLWKSYGFDKNNYKALYLLANDIVKMQNDNITLNDKIHCEEFFANNEAKELLRKNNAYGKDGFTENFTPVKASFLIYVESYKLAVKANDFVFKDKCNHELKQLENKNGLYYFKFIK